MPLSFASIHVGHGEPRFVRLYDARANRLWNGKSRAWEARPPVADSVFPLAAMEGALGVQGAQHDVEPPPAGNLVTVLVYDSADAKGLPLATAGVPPAELAAATVDLVVRGTVRLG